MNINQKVLSGVDRVVRQLPESWIKSPVSDEGVALSPTLNVILKLRKLKGNAELYKLSPKEARKLIRQDLTSIQAGFAVGAVRDIELTLGDCCIGARHYKPKRGDIIPALLVFFHGGGYVTGNLDTHDDVCRLLCSEMGMQVLSVDYRRPPEHPFPKPLDDALSAVRWAQENADKFGVNPKHIAVGGDSAGGNMATVCCQDESLDHPVLAQLLLYPGTDRKTFRSSQSLFSKGYFLDMADSTWFYQNYIGICETEANNPKVSPMLGGLKKDTAPAVVVTAGFDVLRDEGEAYAEKLKGKGIATEYLHYPQLVHAFANLVAVHYESKVAVQEIAFSFATICKERINNG